MNSDYAIFTVQQYKKDILVEGWTPLSPHLTKHEPTPYLYLFNDYILRFFPLPPQGLFQKAEALYSMGDFEMALVFYHRGHKLRPELEAFRLGIQKAREAIDNSVGSK